MFSRFVSCRVDICWRGWMLIEWMHLQLPQYSWLSVVSARPECTGTQTKPWTRKFGVPIPHVWSVILWIRVNFLDKTQGGSVDFGRVHMVVWMRMWPSTAPCGFNQASNVILKRFGARCTITEKTDCKVMGFVGNLASDTILPTSPGWVDFPGWQLLPPEDLHLEKDQHGCWFQRVLTLSPVKWSNLTCPVSLMGGSTKQKSPPSQSCQSLSVSFYVSNDKSQGYFLYIEDYTAQLYGDYSKPLWGSARTIQYNEMSQGFWTLLKWIPKAWGLIWFSGSLCFTVLCFQAAWRSPPKLAGR